MQVYVSQRWLIFDIDVRNLLRAEVSLLPRFVCLRASFDFEENTLKTIPGSAYAGNNCIAICILELLS